VSQSALAEMASRGKDYVSGTWRALFKLTMLLGVPLVAFADLHTGKLVALYGADYARAVPLVQAYLAFTLVGRFLGGGTNTATLYAIREEHWPLRIRAVTGIFNLVLAIILIPSMGAMGAVLATGTALILTTLAETVVTIRRTGAAYPLRFAALVALCTAVAAGVSYPLTGSGFVGLLAGGAVFVVAFAASFALSRPLESEDQSLLHRISPRVARWAQRATRG
jgi:O-antigen/teichoic acid export membrane protein